MTIKTVGLIKHEEISIVERCRLSGQMSAACTILHDIYMLMLSMPIDEDMKTYTYNVVEMNRKILRMMESETEMSSFTSD